MEYYAVHTDDGLYHHGIKGQHWGQRRFQNEDGSVTAAGAQRYYGHSGNSFRASNGIKVGAPNSKGVAAFRKVQGTRVGGAALNGMAKMNTAFYGHGKNKERFKKMEERVRKENQAVREANQAHKAEVKRQKAEQKANKKPDSDLTTLVKYGVGGLAIKKARQAMAKNSSDHENTTVKKASEKYGEKGKQAAEKMLAAKDAYKEANKQYSKSFNEYYRKAGQYYSLNKDKRQANLDRFNKAMADGQKVNQAKADYKAAKKEYKQIKRDGESDAKTLLKYGVAGYAIKKARQRRNKG